MSTFFLAFLLFFSIIYMSKQSTYSRPFCSMGENYNQEMYVNSEIYPIWRVKKAK